MSTDQPLAQYLRDGERPALRFERQLAHPPEKVWRALTESEHLQHWLPTDIVGDRRAGATIELPFWPAHVEKYAIPVASMPGRITVWDPPSVFEWEWATDLVRFELTPDGDGTTLVLTTWLSDEGGDPGNTAAGYHVCLDNLVELLDTGAVSTPLVDVSVTELEQQYAAITR
jgi:uncharacterized protein YndB with AHSA1/START domain